MANCHLHFDHSGQNGRIPPGVPIFVQRAEWAKVHEPDYTVPEWIDVPGLTYEVLDGEIEVAPGLRLIPTPGHTAGHQSLVLDAEDGTVVLAGQAVQSRAEWEGASEPSASGASSARDPTLPALRRAPPFAWTRPACISPTIRPSGNVDSSRCRSVHVAVRDRHPAVAPERLRRDLDPRGGLAPLVLRPVDHPDDPLDRGAVMSSGHDLVDA